MRKEIRVLIVDDSAFMRKMLTEIIDSVPGFEVIKIAVDGLDALEKVKQFRPDVVTLDIELPEVDGLTALIYIMEECPTPVIIITGFSKFSGEETVKALEYGAVGFVRKPQGDFSKNKRIFKTELMSKLMLASTVNAEKLKSISLPEEKLKEKKFKISKDKVVAIASSSGGPRALTYVIPQLPENLPAPVIVVQHIPPAFAGSLAKRLNGESKLDVKIAENSEFLLKGKVYITPGNMNCKIQLREGKKPEFVLVPPSGEESFLYTSTNKLMSSLAPIYGKNTIGVVLTGMGDDATDGMRSIKKYDGYTIAEAESTAVVSGMPRAAIEAGVVDKVVPLQKITGEIVKAVDR
ncbi:MAG: chemotaxis-specific protein-glutamate methyltransferase CheB, partial [Candidatus Theseobacter exili]|nr:chemotaxis-specific protein-glutamate methyltransferase CheB [Candidatus Theseobacter exili]